MHGCMVEKRCVLTANELSRTCISATVFGHTLIKCSRNAAIKRFICLTNRTMNNAWYTNQEPICFQIYGMHCMRPLEKGDPGHMKSANADTKSIIGKFYLASIQVFVR